MITPDASDGFVNVLRATIVALVRLDGSDLTARQLGVFLTCYLESEAQTVRGLATKLDVSKPAISRALDRLSEFDLTRRKKDPLDRRSVLVQRTATGMAFLRELRTILRDAAPEMRIAAETDSGRQRAPAPSRAAH
jgi:DNA-binding MarR family transcriptional regulator